MDIPRCASTSFYRKVVLGYRELGPHGQRLQAIPDTRSPTAAAAIIFDLQNAGSKIRSLARYNRGYGGHINLCGVIGIIEMSPDTDKYLELHLLLERCSSTLR